MTTIPILAATPQIWREVRRWLFHIGGAGFIPLGVIDNSVIPLPGSMDVMTIVLAARDETWWPYYVFMATIGSVAGGYLTYRIALKGGKAALQRRFSHKLIEHLCRFSERWRFTSVFVPALLPPPMPMVPFLLAAGAMQYPAKRFLAALALGRSVRYTVLAYLGVRYGRQMVTDLRHMPHPALWIVIVLGAPAIFMAAVIGTFIREHKRMNRAHA